MGAATNAAISGRRTAARLRLSSGKGTPKPMISCEFHDGRAEVVINTPPVNALSIADGWALRDLFGALSASGEASVVLVRAEGRGFSAGIDYKELQAQQTSELLFESARACRAAFSAISACRLPVIAAVHGHCMGAGIGVVASCDLVVAAEDARFGLPEGAWSIAYLARLVPRGKLRQMALTCEQASAQELLQYGAVYRVVDRADLLRRARAVAGALGGQRRETLLATKAKLNALDRDETDGAFWLEHGLTYGTEPVNIWRAERAEEATT